MRTLTTSLVLGSSLVLVAACGDSAAPTSATTATSPGAASAPTATPSVASTSAMPASTGSDAPPDLSGAPSASAAPTSPSSTATTTAIAPTSTATTSSSATAAPTSEPTAPPLPTPAAGSADAIAQRIDDVFATSPRYKARFVQKYTIKVQNKTKEQKGTVLVERPNKLSFRYDPPNQNRVVSDGVTIKVYTADDKQLIVMPVKNTEYPGAFGFIMGQGLRHSFTFEINDKAKFDLGPVLVGKPSTPNPQYDQALFYVDDGKLKAKDAGAVAAVLIVDAQGNRNRFEFFEPSFPANIDASEFTFTEPPGTNVIRK